MNAETAAKVRREQAARPEKQIAFLWSRVRCLEEQMDFLMEQVASGIETEGQDGAARKDDATD